jgi:serine/threonine-protein kinase
VALTAYGVLRRHWRRSGLDRPAPGRPVDESTAVLRLSLVIDALFVVHLGLPYTPARPIAAYLPVVGGVLELVMLYQLWLAVLEAERRHRPLRRERRLWLGLALSLLPPCISFLRVLAGGHL